MVTVSRIEIRKAQASVAGNAHLYILISGKSPRPMDESDYPQ
jgi:hypothetical protein